MADRGDGGRFAQGDHCGCLRVSLPSGRDDGGVGTLLHRERDEMRCDGGCVLTGDRNLTDNDTFRPNGGRLILPVFPVMMGRRQLDTNAPRASEQKKHSRKTYQKGGQHRKQFHRVCSFHFLLR